MKCIHCPMSKQGYRFNGSLEDSTIEDVIKCKALDEKIIGKPEEAECELTWEDAQRLRNQNLEEKQRLEENLKTVNEIEQCFQELEKQKRKPA